MFKTLLTFLLCFISLSDIYSQKCFEYQKTNCFPKKSKFSYMENSSSVSFEFSSGEQRQIPFNLLLGIDYRITLCADPIFEGIIKFIIRGEDGKEIYNNSTQNFNLNLEFSSRKTHNVVFELSAPEPNKGVSDTVYFEGCIGVLIEEMVSVKTGF